MYKNTVVRNHEQKKNVHQASSVSSLKGGAENLWLGWSKVKADKVPQKLKHFLKNRYQFLSKITAK